MKFVYAVCPQRSVASPAGCSEKYTTRGGEREGKVRRRGRPTTASRSTTRSEDSGVRREAYRGGGRPPGSGRCKGGRDYRSAGDARRRRVLHHHGCRGRNPDR